MSGVFEKEPLVEPPPKWASDTDTDAQSYRYFYCPKCRARHKYGHLRDGIDCYRCFRHFCPNTDSYRREVDRISNLTPEEQHEAHLNIYGMTKEQYLRKCEIRQQKREAYLHRKWVAREAKRKATRFNNSWYGKLINLVKSWYTKR